MCHLAFWAFLFLSPLTYWRGTGFNFVHYMLTCMQPLVVMVVFYLNYLVLAPKLFVAGKHRYDLLINVVLLISLGTLVHYWMDFVNILPATSSIWLSSPLVLPRWPWHAAGSPPTRN